LYLRKLRRDIIVLIPAEVWVKDRVLQGVCRLSEVLGFSNPVGRVRDYCCKECIGSKTQITKGYLKVFRKEFEKRSFSKMEFASERSGGI
jgi:hypothetical protein